MAEQPSLFDLNPSPNPPQADDRERVAAQQPGEGAGFTMLPEAQETGALTPALSREERGPEQTFPTPSQPSDAPSAAASPRLPIGLPRDSHQPFHDPALGARRVLNVGRVIVGLVTVGMLCLLGRVLQLQTRPDPNIAALIDTQRSKAVLLPRRGAIVDVRGRMLCISHFADTLFVDPKMIDDPGTFSEHVGYGLDYDPAWIEQTIARRADRRYVPLDKMLSPERAAKLREIKLAGLGTQSRIVREYPQGQLAAQVIGFVGAEGKGLDGLELALDKELAGTPGSLSYLRDARRRALWADRSGYTAPVDGKPVRLSIDITIQQIAETELAAAVKQYGAKSGQLVVMNPNTGEVMAMANYPTFNPANAGKSTPDQRRNRCVTDAYEPGSIFKPFLWAYAIESKTVHPNQVLDCTTSGVYRTNAGRSLRDAHAHGRLTVVEVLVLSSNIGMAQIGERVGAAKMYDVVRRFGFGQSTKVGIPGESPGLLQPLKRWTSYSITSIPMGQEIAVTPLQMVRGFSVFANGGLLVSPTIRAVDEPGMNGAGGTSERPVVFERVLSPATAKKTLEVLRRVVTEGTGRKAESKLYTVWGKTGTAQVAQPGRGYIPNAYVGSFVGGAPLANPRVVVVCSIHLPDKKEGYYGGVIAAPAVKNVIEQTLLYLGVTPDQPPSEGDAKPTAAFASHD